MRLAPLHVRVLFQEHVLHLYEDAVAADAYWAGARRSARGLAGSGRRSRSGRVYRGGRVQGHRDLRAVEAGASSDSYGSLSRVKNNTSWA